MDEETKLLKEGEDKVLLIIGRERILSDREIDKVTRGIEQLVPELEFSILVACCIKDKNNHLRPYHIV